LDRESRRTFFRAAALLPAISLSLRVRGFRATQKSLLGYSKQFQGGSQGGAVGARPLSEVDYCRLSARMVNAAVRNLWRRATCLEKSLAIWSLLGRQGVASQLRIGARNDNGKFEAHAWVEHNGIAINEPENLHRHYATFDTAFPLPTSGPS
jgi:hypothetical protein